MSEESEVTARGNQVNALLQKKDKAGALALCLQNPPVNAKTDDVKDANTAIVEKVLATITDSEMGNLINGLSPEACDVLMKYVYKLMGKNSNNALMLKLHAQLVEKAGLGSIVRALTDRKQV